MVDIKGSIDGIWSTVKEMSSSTEKKKTLGGRVRRHIFGDLKST